MAYGQIMRSRLLKVSSKLKDVCYSSNRTNRENSPIVVVALEAALTTGVRNTKLARLDIQECDLTEDTTKESIGNCLRATNNLDILELRMCDLEDKGTKIVYLALIASGLAPSRLDLRQNSLSRTGVQMICSYLQSDTGRSLTALRLDDNQEITSQGVVDLVAALSERGTAIEELGLNKTCCGDIGARALSDAYAGGRTCPYFRRSYCLRGCFWTRCFWTRW